MADITRVYLITGFLGSGKTTFLNRIIKHFPKDRKLMILMNEFGEIGIDGTLIEGEDIDMMEISKGSIFCVCVKTDFIKGLYELNTTVRPDVLLIESTGVANPSDLKRDLKLPIFNDRFQFSEQFCLLDAINFLDAYEAYASLEKQIASSTIFIINKTDLASAETIQKVKAVVHEFHPAPVFYETTYADIPLDKFLSCAEPPSPAAENSQAGADKTNLSPEQLEAFIEELLDSSELEITPPDQLMSVAYRWSGTDLDEVSKATRNLPASVVRAKGFLEEKGRMYILNYVMGHWSIEESKIAQDRIQHKNVVVFIGPPESMPGIQSAVDGANWSTSGTFQPYSGGREPQTAAKGQ